MSDTPFEFTYRGEDDELDLSKTPELGRLIHEWVNETYGADHMVFGILAFSSDKNLVGVRVEAAGVYTGSGDDPAPTSPAGWDEAAAWMRSLDSEDLFTFVRRTGPLMGGEPIGWDIEIAEIANALADEEGFTHQGHFITDGESHGMLLSPRPHDHSHGDITGLLRALGINPDDIEAMTTDVNPNNPSLPAAPGERPNVPPAFYN